MSSKKMSEKKRRASRVVVRPERAPTASRAPQDPAPRADRATLDAYWRRNLNLTLTLLAVWFVVGYVLAIIFAPALNAYTFLGAPLGFWIAQNGAIYVFVLLILIYAVRMNRLDEEFDVGEQ
jgi:putative solute:sodium symporter small subunit